MAFAYSDTDITAPVGAGLHVSARATDVGAADLIPIKVHCGAGKLLRWRVTRLSGSGTTVIPKIYYRNSASEKFEVVRWTDPAASTVSSQQEQDFHAPDRELYVLAAPNTGSDNVVLVEMVIGARA